MTERWTHENPAQFLAQVLAENGYRDGKLLDGETRYAAIAPKMYTHAIICGRVGDYWGFYDCWCYRTYHEAQAALAAWNGEGEPEGWIRHPDSGRRVSTSADEHDEDGNKVGAVGVRYVRR